MPRGQGLIRVLPRQQLLRRVEGVYETVAWVCLLMQLDKQTFFILISTSALFRERR